MRAKSSKILKTGNLPELYLQNLQPEGVIGKILTPKDLIGTCIEGQAGEPRSSNVVPYLSILKGASRGEAGLVWEMRL
jgi:hypothetical protein